MLQGLVGAKMAHGGNPRQAVVFITLSNVAAGAAVAIRLDMVADIPWPPCSLTINRVIQAPAAFLMYVSLCCYAGARKKLWRRVFPLFSLQA
jgi:hypothetical protein